MGKLKNSFRPNLESLEARETPATASMAGGILVVQGTAGADDILVTKNANGSYSVSGVNGTFGGVKSIKVYGQGGDDLIEVSEAITISATLNGGAGNDTLKGGSGHDLLYGNEGNDNLNGRAGNDYLNGWTGKDAYVGGVGYDTVVEIKSEVSGATASEVERWLYY